jgi:adenylate cyclase
MTGGADLARRYETRLFLLVLGANYFAVVILIVQAFLAFGVYPDPRGRAAILGLMLVPGLPAILVASLSGVMFARRMIRPALRWIGENRLPTAAEHSAVSALPRRLATLGMVHWLTSVILLLVYLLEVVRYRPGVSPLTRSFMSALLLALVPWSLAYLFVERALRPVFAAAVTTDVASLPKTMGIVSRLVLAWIGTTGLPIVGILLIVVGVDPFHRERAIGLIIAVCLLGSTAGIAVAVFTGRTIIDPLRRARAALQSIERGDLDVSLAVSDSAELGDLELGINRMALGLRERERLRDLFGRHVGTDVAQRAMAGDFALGGERCDATVMFVDIIGSTGLTQRRDPDAVVGILNRFFDSVVRTVAGEGGFVNKFQGDGALCVFGAPVQQHDHAQRGLRAARALAEELAPMGDIAAAIGVSSGEVVAGNIGAADRYEFTVIGDAVNEAARLTEEAKLRSVHLLVSDRTVTSAAAHDDGWVAGEMIQLRGRSEPTRTYVPI